MINTCHTFKTPEEAIAFIRGYDFACEMLKASVPDSTASIGIDEEEPQTVLADLNEDAYTAWIETFVVG